MVFVGGATVHLWLTEPAAPPVRATDDVDVICDVATLAEYYRFGDRLRERGLSEDTRSKVICRWVHSSTGLGIDVMPLGEDVLGFSNDWYGPAMNTAREHQLDSGRIIRVASPPLIVATKLRAWRNRGEGDALGSLDVHDVVVLVDGRPELIDELLGADARLRSFVGAELKSLQSEPYFDYVLDSVTSGYGSQASARAGLVRERFSSCARI